MDAYDRSNDKCQISRNAVRFSGPRGRPYVSPGQRPGI